MEKPSKSDQRRLAREPYATSTVPSSSSQTARAVNRSTRVVARALESTHLDEPNATGHLENSQEKHQIDDGDKTKALRETIQKPIDAAKLPTLVSVFFVEDANTPEKLFNFGSCTSLEAIQAIVDKYFAPNLRKLKCPSNVTFRAVNCFHPKEMTRQWGGRQYIRVARDQEFQVWYKSVMKKAATTGQLVRIQVCLWSDQVDCAWNKQTGNAIKTNADGSPLKFVTYTDGGAWLLKQLSTDNPDFIKAEYFEVIPGHDETVLWPAYRFREAMALERLVDEMRGTTLDSNRSKLMEKKLEKKRAELETIQEKKKIVLDRYRAASSENKKLEEQLESANGEVETLKTQLEDLKKQLLEAEALNDEDEGMGDDEDDALEGSSEDV